METAYTFFARAAQFSEDGGLGVIGGDIQSLEGATPYKPDALVLVTKIEFAPEECGRTYEFRLEILGPDQLTLPPPPVLRVDPPSSKEVIGAVILVEIDDITFPVAGTYRFSLFINDTPLKTLNLRINADQMAPEAAATV